MAPAADNRASASTKRLGMPRRQDTARQTLLGCKEGECQDRPPDEVRRQSGAQPRFQRSCPSSRGLPVFACNACHHQGQAAARGGETPTQGAAAGRSRPLTAHRFDIMDSAPGMAGTWSRHRPTHNAGLSASSARWRCRMRTCSRLLWPSDDETPAERGKPTSLSAIKASLLSSSRTCAVTRTLRP